MVYLELANLRLMFFAVARTYHADCCGGFSRSIELRNCGGFIFFRHDNDHADTAVEGAIHFLCFDIALLLQPVEQLGHLPSVTVDVSDNIGG